MKKLSLLLVGLVWSLIGANAQEYKTKLANAKDQKVTLEIDAGDIRIEGYTGDEVIIQASGYEAPPDRAKGLRALYNSATDNSGIGLAITPTAGGLRIEKATRKAAIKYTLRLPRQVAILYQQTNWQMGDLTISNMDGDLEVKTNNGGISLVNVTGPVVANTTNGEIKVVYAALSQAKPSAISTINGPVDITLPTNTKATMKLRSIHGEMYTDFDLGVKSQLDGLAKVGGGNKIDGTINGGGVDIELRTINSNIYIRKQK